MSEGPMWTIVIYLGLYNGNSACYGQCLFVAHIQSHIFDFSVYIVTFDLG